MKSSNFPVRIITTVGLLSALCAVLGYIAIDLTFIKLTFESLPVLLGGLLLGPVYGMLTGCIGTLIYQVLRYGVSMTTLLWMLPYILSGLFTGLYAMKKKFLLGRKELCIIAIVNELAIMLLNTGVIYVDSKLYGYYSAAYVFGSFFVRLLIAVLKGVVFGAIMPALLKALRPIVMTGVSVKDSLDNEVKVN